MKFRDLLRVKQIQKNDLVSFDNQNTQSSTAIIIRRILSPKQSPKSYNYQLLLLQRDPQLSTFSGEVCFPGGKRQPGQSSWDTVLREVKQQTGLVLDNHNLIIKTQSPYIVYQSRNKIHTITLYIFQIFPQSNTYPKIVTQQKQISDYKWIPLDFFLVFDQSRYSKVLYTKNSNFPFQKALPFDQKEIDLINRNYEGIYYPSIKVGLPSELYGSTYMIITAYMNRITRYLSANGKISKQMQENIQRVLNDSHDFRVKLKDSCPNRQYYQREASKVCQDSMRLFSGVWPKL